MRLGRARRPECSTPCAIRADPQWAGGGAVVVAVNGCVWMIRPSGRGHEIVNVIVARAREVNVPRTSIWSGFTSAAPLMWAANESPEIPTVGGSAHRPAQPQLTGLPTRLLVLVIRVPLSSTLK
jgi:hypothetical protein